MKKKVFVVAAIVIGLASVAYAAFSQTLTITGTGSTNADWNVKITGITQTAASGASTVSAPTFSDTTATFNVELAYPGASATYDVAIANTGTIPAKLESIAGVTEANAAAPEHILYELTGVSAGTTIAAVSGTNTATVKVTWDPASTVTGTATKTATITLNYVQDTP